MPGSLYYSFLGRRILRPINQKIVSSGYNAAFRLVLKKTNSQLITKGLNPSLKKTLQSNRVLLISNHPGQAEVLAILAALPQRSDYYLIASHSFFSILPAFDRHLIPVYVSHSFLGEHVSWKLKFFNKFHHHPNLDQVMAHQRNIDSIALASQKLSKGALVQIFPVINDTTYEFSPGVGFLLKNSQSILKTKVIMIHVAGSSDFDYLRLFPFLGKLLPPFKITFSPVYPASGFVAVTGRKTAKNLEITYRAWVDSISHQFTPAPITFRAVNRSYLIFRSLLLWLFASR
jgi:hypothetical protein